MSKRELRQPNRENYHYHHKFPKPWVNSLRRELHSEFLPVWSGGTALDGILTKLPPVVENSKIGRVAGRLPSKPEGISLWGKIYYTPNYPKVRNKYRAHHGHDAALIYEFGMYAHETYHAVEQILTGKSKWFIKYVLRLIKTPNAWKHPMEIPAYDFQSKMKDIAASHLSNP